MIQWGKKSEKTVITDYKQITFVTENHKIVDRINTFLMLYYKIFRV